MSEKKNRLLNSKKMAYGLLYVALLLYSLVFVFYKLAVESPWYYIGALMAIGIYALLWQQVLKKLPLVTAYANKGIVVIYGMILGALFFKEAITWNMLLGSVLIIAGMIVVAGGEEK